MIAAPEPTPPPARRLPQAAIDEILALRPRYPTLEALLLPALHIAQRYSGGWLPASVQEQVGELLGLSAAKVAGVVSFYDLFHDHPVGRHRIRVCTNLSCQLRGANEIVDALKSELGVEAGVVTPDGRCSFVTFECLGSCDTAPMMMVDDDYHENLNPARAREIARRLD